MDIKYKIKFYSDWHCGSGLTSGADLDLLVIKDKQGLPFVPGKTIKGLVREAVEEINSFSTEKLNDTDLENAFGFFDKDEKAKQGTCFFTNAAIEEKLARAIEKNKLQEFMYRSIASTAINENGVAEEHSLRQMEVTVPCELFGEILDVPNGFETTMENGLKFIKRLGQNRNRGLGRCSFEVIDVIKEGGKS